MLTVQLWHPDTCGCTVHQVFDDEAPDDARVITAVTHEEAVVIHRERHRAKPESTFDPDANPQPTPMLCPAHAHLGETPAKHAAVSDENTRKNRALEQAVRLKMGVADDGDLELAVRQKLGLAVAGELDEEEQQRMYRYIHMLHRQFKWSFDGQRRLVIDAGTTLTQADKASLRGRANGRFGVGKVVIT